jgi:hypothetical protein
MLVPETPAPQATPTPTRRTAPAANQITLPYDSSTQITKEYPQVKKPPAVLVDDPEVDITWEGEGDPCEVPELAHGSGPAPVDGTPLVAPSDRKRAQSRPSMKTVLAGEIDTESELDVPTFIRRHSAHS